MGHDGQVVAIHDQGWGTPCIEVVKGKDNGGAGLIGKPIFVQNSLAIMAEMGL